MKRWTLQRKLLERDKLTLIEYLETDFLDGLDYGQHATGWRMHEAERQARAKGFAQKPKLSDKFITGLDSIPWGVFEQALADAHTKAPNIVEPYLKTFLAIPRKSIKEACNEYKVTYTALRTLRKDAVAIIRGCLPVKARRIIALVELEREREEKLLKDTKKKLKAEAQELFAKGEHYAAQEK
jgi:hypothetical protein